MAEYNINNIPADKFRFATGKDLTHDSKLDTKPVSYFQGAWRRFCKNRIALAGFIVFMCIMMVVVFANVIVPYEMAELTSPKDRLTPPCAEHPFGTDEFGRSVFARIIHAAPNSLFIGFTVSFGSLLVGGTLGIACGYFGGKFDNLVMRFLDMISALPGSLLAIVMVAVLGPNMRNLIIALIVGHIAGFARMSRSVALSISEQEYVKAENKETVAKYLENTAKAFGGAIELVSFFRYEKGEGLQKREEDFAAEIEKMVNNH